MEFEVKYQGQTRILVALDYAGEVFRDAFVNDDSSSPQAKALLTHIDRAMALMLLVDPAVASGEDIEARVDDDYGMVQAVQRVRDWPGGDQIPIVLLLTKADQNRHLFPDREATRRYIAEHYRPLMRTLGSFKAFHVAAVQSQEDGGRQRPKHDSQPVNVVEPLKFCLDKIAQAEQQQRIEEELAAQRKAQARAEAYALELERRAERASNWRLFGVVVAILLVGAVVIACICMGNR